MNIYVERTLAFGLGLALSALVAANPAYAATDIFASGKEELKATAGDGSAVEMAMLGTGLAGAVVTGLMTRNWFAALGGFVGGSVLWNVGKTVVFK